MTLDQIVAIAILVAAIGLFVWGRWRFDVVAMLVLLAVVTTGLVPAGKAFAGFGHPAVITVAAVLVLSRALRNSGVVDLLARRLEATTATPGLQVFALALVVAVLSSVMNNVGALALLLPVALQIADRSKRRPSELLMPLSFGSLLGGLVTMIGTPPNIVIATYRQEVVGAPFGMFDFTPVGLPVAVLGVLFVGFVGWRLVPHRIAVAAQDRLFQIRDYITEVRIGEASPMVGRRLGQLVAMGKGDLAVISLIRDGRRHLAPHANLLLRAGDELVIEADPASLKSVVQSAQLEPIGTAELKPEKLRSESVGLFEAVVTAGALVENRNAANLKLHSSYGINLLAVARQGQAIRQRLSEVRFRVGDVLLLQGDRDAMPDVLGALGCLPLAARELRLDPHPSFVPLALFAAAIASVALGLLAIQVAFTAAVAGMILLNRLSLRELYDSVDWPVIVLLGGLMPLGHALEGSGTAALIAGTIAGLADFASPVAVLVLLLVFTMLLTDVINNAATAVLMAPIAAGIAAALDASVDPFLMTVAIGCSCSFLTPIGHQSNVLVMGPGGYRFGDYWRMGLPLDLLIVAVAIPLILFVWPM